MLSDNWSLLRGHDSGSSSFASADENGFFDWSEPFEFQLSCTSLNGWPKLLFEVFSCDSNGRIEIAAYGWCHIPMSAGDCDRTIYCQRPQNGSFIENLHSKFLGSRSRYLNPEVVTSSNSRLGHVVESVGSLDVHFSIATTNFVNCGVLMQSALYSNDGSHRLQSLVAASNDCIDEEPPELSSETTRAESCAHNLAASLTSPCALCSVQPKSGQAEQQQQVPLLDSTSDS